jgi:hypothetical protein
MTYEKQAYLYNLITGNNPAACLTLAIAQEFRELYAGFVQFHCNS